MKMTPGQNCLRTSLCVLLAWGGMLQVNLSLRAQESGVVLDAATRDRCLQVLKEGLAGPEFWPAMHAAEGLSIGGYGDQVIEALVPRLPEELDDQKRCGLARELVRAGRQEYGEVMLKILSGVKVYGHIHAAESMYKVKVLGDGTALKRACQQSDNLRLKLMAAAALAQAGDGEALSFLRETLKHEDPQYYHLAAWILGVIGDESDISRLKENLPRCTDPLMKAYLEHALALLGDEEGLKALVRNLSSDDPAIRTYAANFAGDARATGAIDRLKEMLDDPHPDARIRAAQALLTMARR